MHPSSAEELTTKFPELFKYVAICVDDGWYNLIHSVCMAITEYCTEQNISKPNIAVIKEKFGGLRIYADYPEDCMEHQWAVIEGIISRAENESLKICEECGSTEDVTTKGSYIKTLCGKCRDWFKLS